MYNALTHLWHNALVNDICGRVQLDHETENTFSNTRRTTVNDSIENQKKTGTTSQMQIMLNSESVIV